MIQPNEELLSKEITLSTGAKQIDNISDTKTKSDIAAATYIMAGLVLDVETIQRILGREIIEVMKETVTYQEILLKGIAEGEEGTKRAIVLNMLRSNVCSITQIAQFTGLSLEEIERLASIR
jgi:predicted transposase YdaD